MFDPNRTVKLASGALFDREHTWQAYLAEAGDWKHTALLLTGPLIVVSALLAYVVGKFTGGAALFAQLRPTLTMTLVSMVSASIGAAVVAFIFGTLSGAFGGKRSFALGLAATTLAFVPAYLGQVLSQLPWIGGLLGFALFVYALVLLWKIIPLYLEVPDGKRAMHYIASLIATVAVMFVVSMTVGRAMYPEASRRPFASISGVPSPDPSAASRTSSDSASSGGYIDKAMQQVELLRAANEDTYDPPTDGRLSESQVRTYLDVMERAREIRSEKMQKLNALSQKADQQKDVSMGDMMKAMAEASDATNLSTLELQMVKEGGGNWAEHLWVQECLFTAARRPDTDEASRANNALWQKYEERLSAFIKR